MRSMQSSSARLFPSVRNYVWRIANCFLPFLWPLYRLQHSEHLLSCSPQVFCGCLWFSHKPAVDLWHEADLWMWGLNVWPGRVGESQRASKSHGEFKHWSIHWEKPHACIWKPSGGFTHCSGHGFWIWICNHFTRLIEKSVNQWAGQALPCSYCEVHWD